MNDNYPHFLKTFFNAYRKDSVPLVRDYQRMFRVYADECPPTASDIEDILVEAKENIPDVVERYGGYYYALAEAVLRRIK